MASPSGSGIYFRKGRSEFFRMDQRVEEVNSQADSDDQPDNGLDHVLIPSQTVASDGVPGHQGEEQKSDHDIDNIKHGVAAPQELGSCPISMQEIHSGLDLSA
jgi:hypothetical protein